MQRMEKNARNIYCRIYKSLHEILYVYARYKYCNVRKYYNGNCMQDLLFACCEIMYAWEILQWKLQNVKFRVLGVRRGCALYVGCKGAQGVKNNPLRGCAGGVI